MDIAARIGACDVFSNPVCPRVDAWLDDGWVEIGRAIKYNRGKVNDRVYNIVLDRPAKRFRLVEDEPEISHVHCIKGDGVSWGLGEIVTQPDDVFEFEFSQPVMLLETSGYYDLITDLARV